jgi:hypothetical protein
MHRIAPALIAISSLVVIACVPSATSGSARASAAPAYPVATVAPAASATASTRLVLDVPEETQALTVRMVAPRDTDPQIAAPSDPHVVAFDPAIPERGQLFVFLGGGGAPPANAQLILRQAAANGFNAIGLSYPNSPTRDICETNADPACYEKARLETLDGSDRSDLLAVTKANSIDGRLTRLLAHLAERYPWEMWHKYLDAGSVKWSLVRLGGISEGGSYVALIAREREVARVCMFESPVDLIGAPSAQQRTAPAWIAPAKVTPVERYYGLRHVRSSSPQAAGFASAWSTFGMDRFGPAADVDTAAPPYGGSHHLTTGLKVVDDGRPNLEHRAVAGDRVTPRTAEGKPALAPAWQYACFA